MGQQIRFADFSFDPETGQLRQGQAEIRLTPKAAAVLRVLAANAGAPVSKEQLFSTVWSETAVSDDALTSCIQELRKAFGDDAKQPRYIETRHRRGYQFVASLDAAEPADRPKEPFAIAVLPFTDISPEHDQDYICDGLAVELIGAFSMVSGLRVVSRTASFQFRGEGADVRSVGSLLGAGYLLEGSIRKTKDRLRVIVQLVDVMSGYYKWAQQFDRTPEDVFAIQDEIIEDVINVLRGGPLSAAEKRALPQHPAGTAAYEYYLRGLQYLPRMTAPDLSRSAEMFERAAELEPSYGPALAGLATVYATLYEWFGAKNTNLQRAEDASRRAVAVAPELAEARVARGFTLSLSRQYEDAVREFSDAIRINPNLFEAYYYFARASFANGEVERSAELFAKAAEVRREDFQSPILQAQSLRMLGRISEAREANREGVRRAEHALALDPKDPRALSLGASGLFHDDQVARAQEWSRRAIELYPDDMGALINAACLSAKLGHKEEALDCLERVFARGWGKRGWIEHDPDYDILRDEPRFRALLAKLI